MTYLVWKGPISAKKSNYLGTYQVFFIMTFLNLNVVRTRPESSFDAKCVIGALNVASAIEAIKDHFNLTSWTGDPCVHTPYQWTICTTDPSPRITAV